MRPKFTLQRFHESCAVIRCHAIGDLALSAVIVITVSLVMSSPGPGFGLVYLFAIPFGTRHFGTVSERCGFRSGYLWHIEESCEVVRMQTGRVRAGSISYESADWTDPIRELAMNIFDLRILPCRRFSRWTIWA